MARHHERLPTRLPTLRDAQLEAVRGGASASNEASPSSEAPMAACMTNPLYTPMSSGGNNPLFV